LSKPVHILQLGSQVRSIFNMVLIAVVDAQMKCENKTGEEELSSRRWRKLKKVTPGV
jgi:malate dehydrogenase (oxaloacetate-decarboxylating)(NADP+)